MDIKLIISIIALVLSFISLGWNIWIKIKSDRKRLLIQCHKLGTNERESFIITLTNIGKKPIYIRRIELQRKINGDKKRVNFGYHNYSDSFDNKPINPEHWITTVVKENDYFKLRDENGKYYMSRITIVEPTGKKYRTKWFKQNNFR